jgi:hypothetical protein
MTHARVAQENALFAVEHTRRYILHGNLNKEELEEARAFARRETAKEFDGREKMQAFDDSCYAILNEQMTSIKEVRTSAHELRYQACVMAWVALEVLATDLFAYALNTTPSIIGRLQKDEHLRKHFDLKSVGMETLVKNGFDLSKKMGTLLLERYSVDTPASMKAVYCMFCPSNDSLRTVFSSKELRTLAQRRNLIVHRRGVADAKYIEATGDAITSGTRIDVTIEDIASYVSTVCDAGQQMIHATRTVLSSSASESGDSA